MADEDRFESVVRKLRDRLRGDGFKERFRKGDSENDGWWAEVASWRKGRPTMSVWFDRTIEASHRLFSFGFVSSPDVMDKLLSEIPRQLYDYGVYSSNDLVEGKPTEDMLAELRRYNGFACEKGIDNDDHFGFYTFDQNTPEDKLVADAEAFMRDVVNFVEPEFFEKVDIKDIKKNLTATEREQLILARRGQGIFREGLFRLWGGCSVTGCTISEVLRASHIKPWRVSNDDQRLDPHNGLLLTATLDALFDRGLITFDDAGEMIVSRRVSEDQKKFLMHEPGRLRRPLSDDQKDYLQSHREQIFRSA